MRGDRESILWRLLEASPAEWLGFLVAGLVLIGLIYWVRHWFREHEDREDIAHEMLTQFGELHRQGELTDEEYRLIKSRLARQIHPPSGTTVPADTGTPKPDAGPDDTRLDSGEPPTSASPPPSRQGS